MIGGVAATFAAAVSPIGRGNGWPARPIRIVVAQGPGGPPDLIGRFAAERLGQVLAGPVVVENRPGASGIVGVEAVARAPADGDTLLVATLSTHVLVPLVSARVPYDPVADFAPVANLFRSVKALWVPADLPVRTIADFVRYAQARPGVLNYASGGVGSSNHIDAAMFLQATGLDLVHVPYNGPAAGIAGVAAGDAQMMVVSITTGMPLARSGRVRAVALFAAQRSPLLPDVATASEQGLGGVDLSAWIGLMAPAGTPAARIDALNAAIATILHHPDTLAWAERQGLESAAGTPADFARTLADDRKRWAPLLRDLRVTNSP